MHQSCKKKFGKRMVETGKKVFTQTAEHFTGGSIHSAGYGIYTVKHTQGKALQLYNFSELHIFNNSVFHCFMAACEFIGFLGNCDTLTICCSKSRPQLFP